MNAISVCKPMKTRRFDSLEWEGLRAALAVPQSLPEGAGTVCCDALLSFQGCSRSIIARDAEYRRNPG
jgi:hypothetical protein